MKKMTNKYNVGFTLIEVLVALIIIAISFTAVMITLRSTLLIQQKLPDKVISHMIAMNALAEMQLQVVAVPTSSPEVKNTAMANSQWRWQADLITKKKKLGLISIKVFKQVSSKYILQDVIQGYVREEKDE